MAWLAGGIFVGAAYYVNSLQKNDYGKNIDRKVDPYYELPLELRGDRTFTDDLNYKLSVPVPKHSAVVDLTEQELRGYRMRRPMTDQQKAEYQDLLARIANSGTQGVSGISRVLGEKHLDIRYRLDYNESMHTHPGLSWLRTPDPTCNVEPLPHEQGKACDRMAPPANAKFDEVFGKDKKKSIMGIMRGYDRL